MFLIDMEQSGDRGGRFDAHASRMVIAGPLARATRLDIALGDPRPMEKNYNLVVLHAGIIVRVLQATGRGFGGK